ncbi:hypothetical protein [Methanobacterium congolense]|uniref:Region of a membrane-bound protein predicted to be embedded in the membrane n=1 Tax=Methanobacterium congolense TaxID=118062 RepID=A0A1D3KZV7_9EURY|nr:hypothetical protein [Methanobacterium congolense]SCG84941.1 Region of a membrane-bound protein predicted to be embedded in the membrane [Methanobacterium congolense]
MKVKYLGLFATFLVLAIAVQPIYAGDYPDWTPTGINVTDQYGHCQSQFNFPCNTDEMFNVTLWYEVNLWDEGIKKEGTAWQDLDLDIYKVITNESDANGLDISLYYHDHKSTNWNGIVTTPKIQFEPGDYIFIIKYEGSRRLLQDSCMTKVKIHVS